MVPLVAYALVFLAVGVVFIFIHLVLGKLIRPNRPDAEKKTIYECGEPTIGSAWIQFDLRFYVVALLFVIFDVEVAFFFPWAEVFGKANNIAAIRTKPEKPDIPQPEELEEFTTDNYKTHQDSIKAYEDRLKPHRDSLAAYGKQVAGLIPSYDKSKVDIYNNLTQTRLDLDFESNRQQARKLSLLALVEIAVFFGVLLVGFAYLWRRGDLAWVRSTLAEQPAKGKVVMPSATAPGQTLVGASW